MSGAPKIIDAPATIWLNYGDIERDCTHAECYRDGDVTWCQEPVFDSDVKYVRADATLARIAEEWMRMQDLREELAKSAFREAALVEVVECARGLSVGEDWNNGTHAKIYRPKLLAALAKIKEAS